MNHDGRSGSADFVCLLHGGSVAHDTSFQHTAAECVISSSRKYISQGKQGGGYNCVPADHDLLDVVIQLQVKKR